MKPIIALIFLLLAGFSVTADGVRTEGAAPGEFTMDWDAAKTVAAEKKLPIFINFTGSDWCGWCKLMDKTVFSKPEWTGWAKEKLVLVTVDFPQNESLVPAKWRTRNEELSKKYGVEGYPTFVILDSAAGKELGRLGAGRDKTPESFGKEIDAVLATAAPAKAAPAAPVAPAAAPLAAGDGGSVMPGLWTMDFDAAKAVAAEKNLPILLNFTGSDWCYWCKLMHTSVFEQAAWQDWAKQSILLVTIDFPRDKTLVPEAMQKRNAAMQKAFGVRGYPTFVLLQADGKTEAGRLGAGKDKTPETFIAEIKDQLKGKAAETTTAAEQAGGAAGAAKPEVAGEDVLKEGAELGRWTMDLDAAKTLASEKKMPLLLDFTGSDWCGWCKLMQSSVFTKPEWAAWAKENAVLVTIDFPKQKDKVPEAYQSRNSELQQKYGVRGYPTYVVLDSTGSKELGRLGAGKDKTPESFIAEMNELLVFLPDRVEAVAAKLGAPAGDDYRQAHRDLRQAETDLADANARIQQAKQIIRDMQKIAPAGAGAAVKATEPAKEGGQADPNPGVKVEVKAAAAKDGVQLDGVTPGRWTMDYDAARAFATEKGLPLLLDFTGSDWCGWCKLMDKSVFADPEWSRYAAGKIVLVTIDFPQNESIVPEKWKARNAKLQEQYGVEGYPTFVIIDAGGKELGRLGAGQGKTAASFAAEVDDVLSLTEAGIAAFSKSLSTADADAYRKAAGDLRNAQAAHKAFLEGGPEQTPENMKKFMALTETVEVAEDTLRLIRARQAAKTLGERAAPFLAAHDKLSQARSELRAFMAGMPQPSEENTRRYEALNEALQGAQKAIQDAQK